MQLVSGESVHVTSHRVDSNIQRRRHSPVGQELTSQRELLDKSITSVGNIHVAGAGDGEAAGSAEACPLAHKRTIVGKHLDAIVTAVQNVDIAR